MGCDMDEEESMMKFLEELVRTQRKAADIAGRLEDYIKEETWDLSLIQEKGEAVIAIHGPDCEVWRKIRLVDLIADFSERFISDLDEEDKKEIIARGKIWVKGLKRAVLSVENALKFCS
jgi:hypothetical protein